MSKNIQEKIEALYAVTPRTDESTPQWAKELMAQIKELKEMVGSTKKTYVKRDRGYYRFVKELRAKLYADTENNSYPELHYYKKRIGANFKGLLYNKETGRILSTKEAFKVYDYFYSKREKIEDFIIKN